MPVGTNVYELIAREAEEGVPKSRNWVENYKREFLADLSVKNQEVRVIGGGKGGKGAGEVNGRKQL